MDDALEPFYRPLDGLDGERFLATHSTSGPWFEGVQHAGPPTALLIRTIERCAPRPELALSRLTVEVLGPVPVAEVTVRAEVERPGKAIELVAAEMVAGGRPVLRARAWRTAVGDTAVVAGPVAPPPPAPAGLSGVAANPQGWKRGYLDAVELRWVAGGWEELGDGTAWMRVRVPVVEGEEASPLQRLGAVVDSGNGISGRLDIREWLFVNTDLSVHLLRVPTGEWFGLDARTVIGPNGAGVASATVFDEAGQVGYGRQSLVVRPR